MTDTLSLDVLSEPPKEFIKGQTLEFLMDLPPTVPAEFFKSVLDAGVGFLTTIRTQLRKAGNASDDGFIADLQAVFEDPPNCTQLRFTVPNTPDTSEWPLGLVEFDVLFTKTTYTMEDDVAVEVVKTYRSLPVRFTIVDGITRVPDEVTP